MRWSSNGCLLSSDAEGTDCMVTCCPPSQRSFKSVKLYLGVTFFMVIVDISWDTEVFESVELYSGES